MLSATCWAIVLIASCALLCAGTALVESSWLGGMLSSIRSRLLACVACAFLLVLVAVLWKAKALGRLDGRVVQHLVGSQGSTLSNIMSYLTLTGDTIPSLLIATVLAIVIYRQGVHRVTAWVLPIIVIAELVVQLGMWKVFHDTTIGQLHPTLVQGGSGKIPSGSVARLFSVFLIASRLWYSRDARGSFRLATLGVALTAMQLVSRLELGRHLLADIFAGIVLGVLLALLGTLISDGGDELAARRTSRSAARELGLNKPLRRSPS